jgi:UDP-N-acetylglucosamine 2-epimerase (non-hydrolysing)
MITCFIGTRAQLIKMAPVILEIERRGWLLNLVFTGQHKETMGALVSDFGIRSSHKYLYQGKEITGIAQMAIWFARCLWRCLRQPDEFIPRFANRYNIILIHGDTFSTLLGAMAGRLRGIKVAHIEAGLRSGNMFHPFPEEITRCVVFRLSHLAFCPGVWAYANMGRYGVKRFNIGQNTLLDALIIALAAPLKTLLPFEPEQFGIVSIHRFENIFNRSRLSNIVRLIEKAAAKYPVAFVLHPATRKKLLQFGLLVELEHNPRIRLLSRMGYFEFVQLIKNAKFVITDGGGNQEELSYLRVPTLLMRKATERQEGLKTTATLCGYNENILDQFLTTLPKGKSHNVQIAEVSPAKLVVDKLVAYAT